MPKPFLILTALLAASLTLHAAEPHQKQAASPQSAILTVLQKQADDWNRGDLDAFATGYKNSPDILFIGRKVRRGYAQMLAGYKAGYPTAKKMGHLTFSELEVQPLDSRFATVTGRFALARAGEDGGPSQGGFLLVVENTSAGWKIVRDDTTETTPSH